MNNNLMSSRVQMEPNLLKQLFTEVKETIATDITTATKASSFKAIDLWNIQKRGRYANIGTGRKKNTTLSVTHVSF